MINYVQTFNKFLSYHKLVTRTLAPPLESSKHHFASPIFLPEASANHQNTKDKSQSSTFQDFLKGVVKITSFFFTQDHGMCTPHQEIQKTHDDNS